MPFFSSKVAFFVKSSQFFVKSCHFFVKNCHFYGKRRCSGTYPNFHRHHLVDHVVCHHVVGLDHKRSMVGYPCLDFSSDQFHYSILSEPTIWVDYILLRFFLWIFQCFVNQQLFEPLSNRHLGSYHSTILLRIVSKSSNVE